MSVSPSAPSELVIVTRLRAAGCVFAEDEAQLIVSTAQTSDELATMVDRRIAGVPLEHVLGWVEFRALRVEVDPGVFVPRRRTAFLVDQAAALISPEAVVVDLCCGSGAVGAALASISDRIDLYAVDIDPAAVRCARRNISAPGRVIEGDLYAPLPGKLRGSVDVLVVNAPYVPTGAIRLMPPEARLHEPRVSLDGGVDGLDIQRRVASAARTWLAPGGHLLVEASELQAHETAAVFARVGLIARIERSDELGATVVVATSPA
ncbi:putative protein N(5)-glutamine methyltransferase [Rhodococcus marinonascens]|uniref:putative protein N(5)-glutamine methyltransferase n=1 Tax=Rhodococcus marinonascens TaxID=38311 RepID=UPI000932461F|nr:putative protein N(5)-glutamine methyltransferase [Rhodococcus marinonascens]